MAGATVHILGTGGSSSHAKKPKFYDMTISARHNAKWRCLNCGTIFTKIVDECQFCNSKELEKIPMRPDRKAPPVQNLHIITNVEELDKIIRIVELTHRQERILKWYMKEKTYFEISEKVKCSKAVVAKEIGFLRKAGLI